MGSHHGSTARLQQATSFGLQAFNNSALQELHMWLEHARWPQMHSVLNAPAPLPPREATEQQARSKHRAESPQTPASNGNVECSQFKRSVLQLVWQMDLFYSLVPTSPVHLNYSSLGRLMAGGLGDREPELFVFTSLVRIQRRLIGKENISHLPNA